MLGILIKTTKNKQKIKRGRKIFSEARDMLRIVLGVFAYLQSHQIVCIEKSYAVFVFINYMLTKLFKSKLS